MANEIKHEDQGANLNLVVPDDPYGFSAPYANYKGAYNVIAHGPSKQNEIFIYSKHEIARNSMDAQFSPHDLTNLIKGDPQYHQGQPVALFACNAGKWGKDSYAQALAKELNANVIAPTENITPVAFGNKKDYHFKEWIIAEDVTDLLTIRILGKELYKPSSFDKIVDDNEGKEAEGRRHYLKIENPGSFTTFSPTKQINSGSQSVPAINNNAPKVIDNPNDKHSSLDQLTPEQKLIHLAQFVKTLPDAQHLPIQKNIADLATAHNINVADLLPVKTELESGV